jgi:hypothetical protein
MYNVGYKYTDTKDGKVYRVVKVHSPTCFEVEQLYPERTACMPLALVKIVSERYIDNMVLKDKPKFVYRWAAGH